jgi:hypothetical protein
VVPGQHLAPLNVIWYYADWVSQPASISISGDYVLSPITFTSCLGLGNVSAWDLIRDKPFLNDSSDPTYCFGLENQDEKKYLGTVLHIGQQYGRYWNWLQLPSGP